MQKSDELEKLGGKSATGVSEVFLEIVEVEPNLLAADLFAGNHYKLNLGGKGKGLSIVFSECDYTTDDSFLNTRIVNDIKKRLEHEDSVNVSAVMAGRMSFNVVAKAGVFPAAKYLEIIHSEDTQSPDPAQTNTAASSAPVHASLPVQDRAL